jgi:processive 1,2-diacylglycerol beta-glucosyltransferase
MGGGIGVGPLEDVVESLSRIDGATVLTLCGNNDDLREAMEERFYDNFKVKVFGFVKDMVNIYAASDAIVMKPGGLSTSEVLCMKRPFFLCGVIPGQEQRNSDYLLDRGAAKAIFEPRRTAHTVLSVLRNDAERKRLTDIAGSLARPRAGEFIVKKVLENI